MIRRVLAIVALLTLALVSAATAHEHGKKHASAPGKPMAQTSSALPDVAPLNDHVTVWQTASVGSDCDDTAGDACHNHSTFADCTCPAACAGLFSLTVASPRLAAEPSTALPDGTRRLLAMSSAPPTPPPRA